MAIDNLAVALKSKDFNAISEMLYASEIMDVNALLKNGETLLTFACLHGDGVVVSLLLNEGADSTVPNKAGKYPLEIAMKAGNFKALQSLKEADADNLNHPNLRGFKAKPWFSELAKAGSDRFVEIVRALDANELIQASVDIRALNTHSTDDNNAKMLIDTALFSKVVADDDEASFDHLFRPTGQQSYSYTIQGVQDDLIVALMKVDPKRMDVISGYMRAEFIVNNVALFSDELLKKKIELGVRDIICSQDFIQRLATLDFNHEIGHSAKFYFDDTVLLNESVESLQGVMKYATADLNLYQGRYGYQLTQQEAVQVLDKMEALGADPLKVSKSMSGNIIGNTLSDLMKRKDFANDESISWLVKRGIDVNQQFYSDDSAATVLDMALDSKRSYQKPMSPNCIKPLIANGALPASGNLTSAINAAIKDGGQFQLHRGFGSGRDLFTGDLPLDIEMHDGNGRTLLMMAARRADLDVCEELIKLGANPHTEDNKGRNALSHLASYNPAKDFWCENSTRKADLADALIKSMSTIDPLAKQESAVKQEPLAKKKSKPSM